MGIIFLTLVSICILFLILKKKDLFHPAFITLGVWGGLLLLYNLIDHPLYQLSDYFYFVVSLWVFPFFITSIIVDNIKIKFKTFKIKLKCNEKLVNRLYPFFVIILLFVIYETIALTGNFSYDNIISNIREEILDISKSHKEYPLSYRISKYTLRFVYIGFVCYISYFNKTSKNKITFLSILLIISFFITGAKAALISFFTMTFYWLIKKYKWKTQKIVLLSLIFVLLIICVQFYRHSDISMEDMDYGQVLLIYAFSPFPALDSVISGVNQFPTYSWGGYIFESLSSIINLFTLYIPDVDQNYTRWVEIPLPTNVYTCILYYYLDFGLTGIIFFSILSGIFWTVLYKLSASGNIFFEILYSVSYFVIIFSFFGNFLLLQYTAFILYAIALILYLFPFKIKNIQKKHE